MALPKIMPKITSLYGRIFAIFWFTMFLVVLAMLTLPHFDPRKTRDIEAPRYERMVEVRDLVQEHFSHILNVQTIFARIENNVYPGSEKGKQRLFITDPDGNMVTPPRRPDMSYRSLRNFVSIMDNPKAPQQKLYGKMLLAGPLPITLAGKDYFIYFGTRWNEPPLFLLQLFDHPFRLMLAVMLVSTPLLLWLSWALSQPARRLEKAAQRVAQGVFEPDPELEKGTSEFRQAGKSFNQMVEAVNLMMYRQQRLLSDISHELRSPLTRLRMAQALAWRRLGESSDLTRIDTEAQRLEQMIGKLLELSRTQLDSQIKRETKALSHLFDTMLSDSRFEAEQCGKVLSVNVMPSGSILCQPVLLVSAIENIVRNAIHYSAHQVNITAMIQSGEVILKIEDDGQGVPEEELASIFRPFYRVSTARDRHSGGTGLGLAIAENAIQQHQGSIEASSSSLGGLQVTVILPLSV
ncbi:envelope stress sensor histidine kinase CpxA [Marinomonas algarum]|uniref:histidine kinase n=1 Tax=Marinomonas algarum TaxID=2883105 RepID=A0A9X1IPS9_9GAMM|nr:envelope stress sensor histidine kinase CpxA [Marinomonas algarum]MCB5162216.1 envelope stress sensor histidine kinase CpxA [Marinomonas algarum]